MSRFQIPTGSGRSDFVERKSRFIGEAARADSTEFARARVKELRAEHPRARHVAWAYVLGPDGSLTGMSDDGEPRGTAGRPILDPIVGSGLTWTLVTVVRYFGGIKLGTGGLSEAYGRCSREAIGAMPRTPVVELERLALEMDYRYYERVLHRVEEMSGEIVSAVFGDVVRLSVDLPRLSVDLFVHAVGDISRGSARVEPQETPGQGQQ